MDKALFLASSTGKQIMRAQAVNTNNLANANTVGFRKDFALAKDLAIHGAGHDSRVYSQTQGKGSYLTAGTLMSTGRDLDIAIRGDGWLAVQGLDGTEGYTRGGNLRVSPGGLMTTASGHPVMGNNGGPITLPPYDKLEIGGDGTISIVPRGQEATTLVVVDRIKMVKPEPNQISKGEDGLFRTVSGDPAPPDGSVKLFSGMLETSNVNSVESMITMMELQRKYELNIKMMEKTNELDGASAQLMKMT